MKAIRIHEFGDPGVMQLEDVPEPQPGPGQVAVHLLAVGVNPVETYVRKGIAGPVTFPFTPGTDGAGVVAAVGEGVAFKPGDRVYLFGSLTGTYAQKTLCRAGQVWPLPASINFAQGAALGVPYLTACLALCTRGKARAGQTVLVHGASGGVGIAAVQLARAAGLTVIGTAGTPEGRRLVLEQGAHHVLDHSRPEYWKELADLTGGRGPDLIVEMLANANLARDLTAVARYGCIVIVGSRGPVEINPREAMLREVDIRAMRIFNATEAELASHHALLRAGLENGSLRPVVRTELPLAQAPKAHEMVMAPGAYGKIVLVP
jgi:NADPH2:quinone reductase